MSDTTTPSLSEQANLTVKALTKTLTETEQRMLTERVEYEAKRDKAVLVAHQLGDQHSISSALDDLLEEFGLPRRPRNVVTTVNVRLRVPVTGFSVPVTRAGHQMRAQGEGTAEFSLRLSLAAKVSEGCGCDNAEAALRTYLRDAYGSEVDTWQYQIAAVTCVDAACRNGGAALPALDANTTIPTDMWRVMAA